MASVLNPSAAERLRKQGRYAEYRAQNYRTQAELEAMREEQAQRAKRAATKIATKAGNRVAAAGARKTLEKAFKKK